MKSYTQNTRLLGTQFAVLNISSDRNGIPDFNNLDTWHNAIDNNDFEESIEGLDAKFMPRVADLNGTDGKFIFSGAEIADIITLTIKYSDGTWTTINETVSGGTTVTGLWEISGTDLIIGNDGTNWFTGQVTSILGYDSGSNLIFQSIASGQGDYEYELVNFNHATWSGTGDRFTYDLQGSLYAKNIGYTLWQKTANPDIQVPFDINGNPISLIPGVDIPTGYTETRPHPGSNKWNMADSLVDMEVEGLVFQNDTAGFAFADQTDAYGLVFDGIINKGGTSNLAELYIIASDTTSRLATNTGYIFLFNSDDSIQFFRMNGGSVTILFNTGGSYMENDEDYRVFVWRNETLNEFVTGAIGTLAIYIQGKSKPITSKNYEIPDTNDMELVAVSSGSNPVTDNTYTSSNNIVLDFDAGNEISKINVNGKYISPYEFTVSSGTYSIIDDPANEIFNRLNVTRQTAISRASDFYDDTHPYRYQINEIADPRIYDTFFEAAYKDKIFGRVVLAANNDVIKLDEISNYADPRVGNDLARVLRYNRITNIYP